MKFVTKYHLGSMKVEILPGNEKGVISQHNNNINNQIIFVQIWELNLWFEDQIKYFSSYI